MLIYANLFHHNVYKLMTQENELRLGLYDCEASLIKLSFIH